MSWDVFAFDFPKDIESIKEIPADWRAPPLRRTGTEIIDAIQEIMPEADFSDPTLGQIDVDGASIEIALGDETGPRDGICFHVRGGEVAVGILARILTALDLRAVESTTGDFFKPAGMEGLEQFRKWRAFRDSRLG